MLNRSLGNSLSCRQLSPLCLCSNCFIEDCWETFTPGNFQGSWLPRMKDFLLGKARCVCVGGRLPRTMPPFIIMSLLSATTSVMLTTPDLDQKIIKVYWEMILFLHTFSDFKTSNTFLFTEEESAFMTLWMLAIYKLTVGFDDDQVWWLFSPIWLSWGDKFVYSLWLLTIRKNKTHWPLLGK